MFYVYPLFLSIFYPLVVSQNHIHGVGQVHDGLYLLQQSNLAQVTLSLDAYLSKHHAEAFTALSSISINSFCISSLSKLWHSRLGHPSDSKLHSLVQVLPISQKDRNQDCMIYTMAKQKRFHFPFNNYFFDSPFELVHIDGWGPYSIPTSEGFKYILWIMLVEPLGYFS